MVAEDLMSVVRLLDRAGLNYGSVQSAILPDVHAKDWVTGTGCSSTPIYSLQGACFWG